MRHQPAEALAVNRSAITVVPAQPFLDWLRGADPTASAISLTELQSEATTYLVPEIADDRHAERVLKKHFDAIFTRELEGWYRDTSTWPKKRSLAMFNSWFEVSIQSVVLDVVHGPITREED